MTDERRLGLAVVDCDGGGACPGLCPGGAVVNERAEGRPPRGFFVHPRGRKLSEVDVVVIGQNPASAGGFERHLNRVLAGREDRFDIMTDAVIAAIENEPYYRGLELLLRNLWPNERDRVVLFAEAVYCESRTLPARGDAGKRTTIPLTQEVVRFCADRHLAQQLASVPKSVSVICNGKIATEWFQGWAARRQFEGLWAAVDHSSGSRSFKSLFDGKKLRPNVQQNWNRVRRDRKPRHLLKGAELL